MSSTTNDTQTRRALLLGGIAALVTTAAVALGRSPVAAGDGQPLIMGAENEADSVTRVRRSTSGPALMADASGPGVALVGTSVSGIGAYGIADTGHGVLGSSQAGSGVEAWSTTGYALRVRRGRIRVDDVSGIAAIPKSTSEVVIRPGPPVAASAFVLLSPLADLGGRDAWFTLQPDERTFTVHLSSAAETDLRLAWLMIG